MTMRYSMSCMVGHLRKVLTTSRFPHKFSALSNSRLNCRCYSKHTKNEWKDGAVVYTTSNASRHSVNKTIGLDERETVTWKPLVIGSLCFALIMYVMFFYEGERNDVFQTITPESVKEQYEKSTRPEK